MRACTATGPGYRPLAGGGVTVVRVSFGPLPFYAVTIGPLVTSTQRRRLVNCAV